MTPDQVRQRRAVEALRSGVPSWDAVAALGSGQAEAEDRFAELLKRTAGAQAGGLLVGAGFGAGKSHLLLHLTHLAVEQGFAVSTVVISKETPLHDPAKVFLAAVESLTGPGRSSAVLADAADALDPDSPQYVELTRWANGHGGPDSRFAATLLLHQRLRGAELAGSDETVDGLVRFWAGDPIRVPELRRSLKDVGAGGEFVFGPVPGRELARQRFGFAARLLRAAGYAGWVVLFDEVELIGRYSLLQRARSYAELARWVDGGLSDRAAPLAAVLAFTDDYEAAVLVGKDDRTVVPGRVRDKQTPEWDEIAGLAEKGMRHLSRDLLLLEAPDAGELDRAYAVLKDLHGAAYGWSPPDVPGLERLGATRMRQYVRAWINAWDLIRLDPSYTPETSVVEIASTYDEQLDLG
ncbi:MAG: hypothetical protein NVSMB55_08260 [Mycobacteriales bacterium]